MLADTPDKTSAAAERLKEAIAKIQTGEDFAAWLKVSSKFWQYSWNNQLMIWSQRPQATRVAGFNKWKEEFKREVKKGERGIAIFAPMFVTSLSEESGEPVKRLTGFKVVYVFDVAQTEGPPLPEPPRPDTELLEYHGDPQLEDAAVTLCSSLGVSFAIVDQLALGSAHGDYDPVAKHIRVSRQCSMGQRLKVLLHELAHHYSYEQLAKLDGKAYSQYRGLHEAIAEGAACVVCDHHGFDTTGYSAPYIAGWHESGDLSVAMSSIVSVAQRMIRDLSKQKE